MAIDIIGTWCIGVPLCLIAAYVFKWGIAGVYRLLTTEKKKMDDQFIIAESAG